MQHLHHAGSCHIIHLLLRASASVKPLPLPNVLMVMGHPVPELLWPEQSPPWRITCAGKQPLSPSDVPASIYLLLKIWPLSIYPYQGLCFHTGHFYTSALSYLVTTRKHIKIRGQLKGEIYGRREERKTFWIQTTNIFLQYLVNIGREMRRTRIDAARTTQGFRFGSSFWKIPSSCRQTSPLEIPCSLHYCRFLPRDKTPAVHFILLCG